MLKIEYGKPVVYKTSDVMGILIMKEIDKELENKTMKEQYSQTLWYSNLIKKKDYIELLKQDSLNKKVGVVCENLW